MTTSHVILCTVPLPGVEVVTCTQPDGSYLTEIHGGRLDGAEFACVEDWQGQHGRVSLMARMASWSRYRVD